MMKRPIRTLVVWVICAAFALFAQVPGIDEPPGPARLPNGMLQSEEILRAEYKQSLEDVAHLIQVAAELQQELLKNEQHVLSLSSLKKADELQRLSRRIRNRLRK
jgi:hypothetical protein